MLRTSRRYRPPFGNQSQEGRQEAEKGGKKGKTSDQKQKEEAKNEEPLPDLEKDFNEQDVKNITKIQASIRGLKARKEVKEAKSKSPAPKNKNKS
jgi:anion-transporting  ArsA/GET3 family ATPase